MTKNTLGSPTVSIIVRMYNESSHLNKLFTELKKQSFKDFEIISVDSGSTDGSIEIAKTYSDKLVNLNSEDFTYGFSLNQGIAASKGRLIAIISAHTYPVSNRWLQSLVDALEADPNRALAYGKQVGVTDSKLSEKNDFTRLFGDKLVVQSAPNYFCNNANSMIRRDLWETHRFDEKLTGLEDQEWSKHWMDLGKNIVYVPEASIFHIHNESWNQIENRYYRETVASRHIGLIQKSSLPNEVLRIAASYLTDITALTKAVKLKPSAIRDITAYRTKQMRGTIRGIFHDIQNQERRALYFPDKNTAVVIRSPNHADIEGIPMPELKPSDVLIRVSTVGICSTDIEIYKGTLGYFQNGLSSYPIVPGHEYSGEVIAVGAKVSNPKLKPGTKVVGECILTCLKCVACKSGRYIACDSRKEVGVMKYNGAYASYLALPSHFVHAIPDDQDVRKFAIAEPLAVVHKAISRLPSITGRSRNAAVIGCGPIGNLSAQLLEIKGHKVTVIDTNKNRLDLIKSSKINKQVHFESLVGFDTIVETTGKAAVLKNVLDLSDPDSEILLLGLPYGNLNFNFENIVSYDRKIIGSVGSTSEDFKAAIDLIPSLDLEPFLQRLIPIGSFKDAWHEHESQKWLKVMLVHDGTI